jgi:hypothetical protein
MPEKILATLHKIYRITMRTFIKYSSNPRPTSYPYITGDGFRALAQHTYDDFDENIKADTIKNRDIVFIGNSRIKKFLQEIHPHIKNQYIIISNNGDENIDEEIISMIDDKIIKWYGINLMIKNQKVVPIPVGIENKFYYLSGIPSIIKRVSKNKHPKINKIFYKFTVSTNVKERTPALLALQKNKYAETTPQWLNSPNYLKKVSGYKFVASPVGSSMAGHRTWEAMYIGVIPIVKSSISKDYFEKIKMPMWVIKDWEDLDSINENILQEKYNNIMSNSDFKTIYMDYWIDKIKNIKD